jgi:integrase
MQGSIKKRVGKRGVAWTAVLDLGRDPVTGKRKQKRLSARTRKEIEDQLTKTLHDLRTGVYLEPSDEPLSSYLPRWLDTLTVRPSSVRKYQLVVVKHLIPALGAVPLRALTEAQIQAFVGHARACYSTSTVTQDLMVLSQALEQAVRWRLIARNPAKGVKPPRKARKPLVVWNDQQVRAFLKTTEGCPRSVLWRMALGTAMRLGELLALRWSDIDLNKRTVRVTRTMTKGSEGWTIGDVKTPAGRRQIALPAFNVQALQSHRVEHPPQAETDRIWDCTERAVWGSFERAQRGVGLPRLTFHGLRHTSATLMLLNGEHPKVVSERLGHSSVAITLDLYSHVLEGMQEAAADRLNTLIAGDQTVTTERMDA